MACHTSPASYGTVASLSEPLCGDFSKGFKDAQSQQTGREMRVGVLQGGLMGATGIRRREILVAGGPLALANGSASQVAATVSDLVVLIPGITGSTLNVNGRPVWSPSRQGISDALFSLGKNLRGLALKNDDPSRLSLGDDVEAAGLVEDVHLIPGLWKIDGYTAVIKRLSELRGLTRGENFQTFAYDWRRDNRATAQLLKLAIAKWLDSWREKSNNQDAKVVILAHSMGGLASRYFVECLQGWRTTRCLVTFGTPYRGAPVALRALSQGLTLGVQLDAVTQLLRSFTSVYQLLPTYPCVRYQGTLLRVHQVPGIPNVAMDRVLHARGFHDEMNKAAENNRRDPEFIKSGYVCLPVVGIMQETVQLAHRTANSLTFSSIDPDQPLLGDGTVPRPSATPFELERANYLQNFVNEHHSSLQNAQKVLAQVVGMITSNDIQWDRFRAPQTQGAGVALTLEADGVRSGMPMGYRGKADPREHLPQVEIEVTDTTSGKSVLRDGLAVDDSGAFKGTIGASALGVGTYRVCASFFRRTQAAVETVSDVFCVLPV